MSQRRKILLSSFVGAVIVAGLSTTLPIWTAVHCNSWECSFSSTQLWAAFASYFAAVNLPESSNMFFRFLGRALGEILILGIAGAVSAGGLYKVLIRAQLRD